MEAEKKKSSKNSFAWAMKKFFKIVNFFIKLVFLLIITAFIASAAGAVYLYSSICLPIENEMRQVAVSSNFADFSMGEASYIYDVSGNMIAKVSGEDDGVYLEYKNIPGDVVNAFIAVEDRTFWKNDGYDTKGMARVLARFVKTKGKERNGASTITQQLARGMYLTRDKTLNRKIKEFYLAKFLTQKYSKQNLMEFYCNTVCFANSTYGIGSAAKTYFNKPVKELTLSETAYLCAIPNRPEYYNPFKDKEKAIPRRDKILNDMYDCGYITKDELDDALKEKIMLNPCKEINVASDYQASYAEYCAVEYLMKLNGFDFSKRLDNSSYEDDYNEAYNEAVRQLKSNGYKIYTSLDPQKQTELQESVNTGLEFNEETSETGEFALQGAGTLIDNESGKVVAIVGGRREVSENNAYSTLNRAFQSPRQPGSTIKPLLVYTPALENGYSTSSTIENIDISKAKEKGVDTADLHGTEVPFRTAVYKSINGCAWKLFSNIGVKTGMEKLEKMNFDHIINEDYNLASSLGGMTYGATTVEMASGYRTLVNHGVYDKPTCIEKIIDKDEKNIYVKNEAERVYSVEASDAMINVLQDVITQGTASSMKWSDASGMAAAGKTGTTNDSKDGWFCGVTPYYTLSIWIGYDTPKTLDGLYGGTYPAAIWKDAMLKFISDKFDAKFDSSAVDETLLLEKYLPGRADDEILSDGYTVGDYRADHETGEKVSEYVKLMDNSLRSVDPNYDADVNLWYASAAVLLNDIKSKTYKTELQTQIDTAYYNAAVRMN